MTAKNQRLLLLVLAAIAVLGAVLLAMRGFSEQASLFYSPADVAQRPPAPGKPARLGGMVEPGSLRRLPDGGTLRFTVGDGQARVPVVFAGIVPDLFREGSGVVAEGSFHHDGSFRADNLLAKHDETYMPPEKAGDRHKAPSLQVTASR